MPRATLPASDPLDSIRGDIGTMRATLADFDTALNRSAQTATTHRTSINQTVANQADSIKTVEQTMLDAMSALDARMPKTLTDSIQQYLEMAEGSAEAASQAAGEAQKTLKLINGVAGDISAAKYGVQFLESAEMEEKKAERFLWWTRAVSLGIAALAIAVFILYLLVVPTKGLETAQIAGMSAAQLIVFSALSYLALLLGRDYKAHMHVAVLNRHRHDALKTFELFMQHSADADAKKAVLLAAVDAIYRPPTTGYLGGKQEQIGLPSVLHEATKS